jgi:hypothetical protein
MFSNYSPPFRSMFMLPRQDGASLIEFSQFAFVSVDPFALIDHVSTAQHRITRKLSKIVEQARSCKKVVVTLFTVAVIPAFSCRV